MAAMRRLPRLTLVGDREARDRKGNKYTLTPLGNVEDMRRIVQIADAGSVAGDLTLDDLREIVGMDAEFG